MTDLNSKTSERMIEELGERELNEVSGGAPKESITFEYGGLSVKYAQQQPDETPAK